MRSHFTSISVTREMYIPDQLKLERFSHTPELGPKILFFSGGTALTQVSRYLTQYTHNSIHIITPFDAGGSSAELRRVFNMPAIGDVRARLMSLADRSVKGHLEVIDLFAYRLPKDLTHQDYVNTLADMISEKHKLIQALPHPMRKIVCAFLEYFYSKMPSHINLAGASIGNLILTSGYLQYNRELDSVIYLFSQLVNAKGLVRPTVDAFAHLCVELENGTRIIGQNNFSGKEGSAITSPIKEMWLSHSLEDDIPICVPLPKKTSDLIQKADIICYPFGSFFSSLLANFLPQGVGTAIKNTHCPKIFVPSTTSDPELKDLSVYRQIEILLEYLKKDNPNIKTEDVLNFVCFDISQQSNIDKNFFAEKNITPLFYPLISSESAPLVSEKSLCHVLLSMC